MKTIEQKAQDFALGQILSEWEQGMTYEDILRVLESEDPEENEKDDGGGWRVVAWQPYEMDEPREIAQAIRDMVSELVLTFGEQS
jgi:hypothetical protein